MRSDLLLANDRDWLQNDVQQPVRHAVEIRHNGFRTPGSCWPEGNLDRLRELVERNSADCELEEIDSSELATPRDKGRGLNKLVGRGFLYHPSSHGVIRDRHPGVQSSRPICSGYRSLVLAPRVESATY